MTEPFVNDPDFTLYVGDVRDVLAGLPDESVHCVVTSPPYWGLRDYGTGLWDGGDPDCDHKRIERTMHAGRQGNAYGTPPGAGRMGDEYYVNECGNCGARRVDRQLGLEATPDEYVQNMVAVFREVRRVLRRDGTCWLNLGSSYFSDPAKGGSGPGGKNEARWSYGRAARGSEPSQARQPQSDPAYGSGGTAPQDSPGPGSAYRDLCDGCLADFLSHRARTADTPEPPEQDALPRGQTGRDSAPTDSVSASPDTSPLDAQESTTLRSWLRLRGPCSRCDTRASSLSDARSSAGDAPASVHTSWLNYTDALKAKDMVPIPWMVAMALQEDGWYLRADIIWSKLNPMPESVTDRPTKSHEYVFLLTRSPRYFFDQDAIREPATWDRWGDQTNGKYVDRDGMHAARMKPRSREELQAMAANGRNRRSVWEIATEPYPDAHFATFPQALVEPCVKAGTSERGCCPECGAPWERETATEFLSAPTYKHAEASQQLTEGRNRNVTRMGDGKRVETTGWQPTCLCRRLVAVTRTPEGSGASYDDWMPVPCVVLDPFMGSGTTAQVARRLGRRSIGIELNADYAALAARRLQQLSLLA